MSRVKGGVVTHARHRKVVKQAKASAQQWAATIRRLPGVKEEELQWVGLLDWLREREGSPITKDEIADFVRANQIEVQEVTKGEIVNNEPLSLREMDRLDELRGMTDRTDAEYTEMRTLMVRNNGGEEAGGRPKFIVIGTILLSL